MIIRKPRPIEANVLTDGRQSARALAIRRGVGRLLLSWDFNYIPELTLPNARRADMMALGPKGQIWIIEIKSSVADFKTDAKWHDYLEYCDGFFFATMSDVPPDIFPLETGLLVADEYGASIIHDTPPMSLKPSVRKALTLRFARSAAATLQSLYDPSKNEKSID